MKNIVLSLSTISAAALAGLIGSSAFSNANPPIAPQQETQQSAMQQPICGDRNQIVQSLSKEFNERPQAVGVVDQNAVMEIFVSEAGSWTILATGTDGNSCLVSSGEGWESKSMVIGVDA